MTPTNKPQAIAARNFIEAMHMHARGEITRQQLDEVGAMLNGSVAKHGKP